MHTNIPPHVQIVLEGLQKAGFEAFIVGGCVRDLLLEKEPVDWDITTNARPEQVQEIFPDSFYENNFGTVGIKPIDDQSATDKITAHTQPIEVTTYRIESTYSDRRRPDAVKFATTLEEDLSRRDFTINAMALGTTSKKTLSTEDYSLEDPFNGQSDLKAQLIRAVGDAHERFNEDALRMMRAIRFSAQLGFRIEEQTFAAIEANAQLLSHVSQERIRDEFSKIIMSPHPRRGLNVLQKTGLLRQIMPELEEGLGVEQNHHHIYTVYEHNVRTLETCPSKKLGVRLAALLHDVGKPRSKRGKGRNCTFYNHEHIGAHMTRKILTRLRYSRAIIEQATILVKNHMFFYSVDEVTEAAVRRIIRRVGLENMRDLIDVRIGDRLGSGTPKGKPYKLRHFAYMVEKVSKDPVSVKMLKIDGGIMIKDLGFTPGPKIGTILDVLLAEVIDKPEKNTTDYLKTRATALKDEDLNALRTLAKEKIDQKKKADDAKIKGKHWVK